MASRIQSISPVPITLPEAAVFARLGFNRFRNLASKKYLLKTRAAMDKAFALCHPLVIWRIYKKEFNDHYKTMLENRECFLSKSLSELLHDSHSVLIMAATVGQTIVNERNRLLSEGQNDMAVIYDAVAGQTADAAMEWMFRYIGRNLQRTGDRLTSRRFSPGFGDLGLNNQALIFELLDLRKVGLSLTPRYMIMSEKSVTAIAGVERITV